MMLKKSNLLVLVMASLFFFWMPEVLAHVKWFVPLDGKVDPNFMRYALNDPAVLTWAFIAMVLICGSVVLDARLPSYPLNDSRARSVAIVVLRVLTGISLLLTAYNGSVIAPHYQWDSSFSDALIIFEALVGVLFILNVFVFYASTLLVGVYCSLALKFGFFEVLEYLNMVGIGLFLLFNNLKNSVYHEKLLPYSVPVLRILTGIALVTLGLSEKLLAAEYGEAFVATYDWNFMQNMGLEGFSDRLFVLSAGVMEVVFGTILILGTTTRLNILVVSGFMLTSNIAFFVEGNISEAVVEVIGHLPIIATAVICVFFGSGQRLKITSRFKNKRKTQLSSH